jgi:ATP-binding cassette subfamily B protein
LAALYENSLFLNDLYEFLDLERKIAEPDQPLPVPAPMQVGITFDHVNFQYPNSPREVLRDVSLEIEPGEVIALVGENGSGKTTLIKLLCRLYEPTSGQIKLDNINLNRFESPQLRQHISIIFQDYVKYNLTARENIRFGNLDIADESESIVEAARRADAHDVIASLPRGYDTVLGKLFESGEELSIGQWQKVALARAFLRDSQIIVLDEPTSAMDPKAEYEVFLKFRELLNGRSAILISHRLSTVRMADRIYVLDKGSIVESGTHSELMKRAGTYADLFEKQAQHYR